jgi:hypothetical protein
MKTVLVAVAVLLSAATALAQMPPCTAVQGWTQQGAARSFDADNLFEYMDGNAEGYILYRFVGMKGITCQSGEATFNIDISEFENTEFAYGMFTSTRDPGRPTEKRVLRQRQVLRRDLRQPGEGPFGNLEGFPFAHREEPPGADNAPRRVRLVPDREPDA